MTDTRALANKAVAAPTRVRADWEPPIGRHRTEDSSIVRALTADFVDHSDARKCGCGERTDGAQASAAGDAAEAPNFPAAMVAARSQMKTAAGDSTSSSSQNPSDPHRATAAAGSTSDTASHPTKTQSIRAVSDSTTP